MCDFSVFLLCILFVFGVHTQDTSWCPDNNPVYKCKSTTLFVMDATNDLKRKQVDQEFEFVHKSVLPGLSFPSQSVAFMSFGDGPDSNPIANIYYQVCAQLYNMMYTADTNTPQSTTLLELMVEIYSTYGGTVAKGINIVLFSDSTSFTDINSAAAYVQSNMPKAEFTVVALSGEAEYWSFFPGYIMPVNITDLDSNSRLADCILSKSCGYSADCYSVYQTSTVAATTEGITTETPRVIDVKTTSASTTNYTMDDGPPCSCDYGSSWNDVIMLFDSSDGTGNEGLQDMFFYMQNTFSWFNVQKTTYSGQYHTRVGIITYSKNVSVIAPLGSLDSAGLMNLTSLPYTGDDEANLEAGIKLAADQFATSAHRPNARKVIIIFATSYNPAGENAPQRAASNFKGDNGIIITYDYIQTHSTQVTVLEDIASPGYYVLNLNDTTGLGVADKLCNANCFCPPNYDVYKFTPAPKNPADGCYYPSQAPSNQVLASTKCHNMNGGSIAFASNFEKTQYLANEIPSVKTMWLGMTYDSFLNAYFWPDGQPVSTGYAPWCANRTTSTQNCVTLSRTGSTVSPYCWNAADCRVAYQYVCQLPPCDSKHYCEQPEGAF